MGHHQFEIGLASRCVDPWEARDFPLVESSPKLFRGVICRGFPESVVDVALCFFCPPEVLFPLEWERCRFREFLPDAVLVDFVVSLHVLHVLLDGGSHVFVVPVRLFGTSGNVVSLAQEVLVLVLHLRPRDPPFRGVFP